jgi:hypothetical protein
MQPASRAVVDEVMELDEAGSSGAAEMSMFHQLSRGNGHAVRLCSRIARGDRTRPTVLSFDRDFDS